MKSQKLQHREECRVETIEELHEALQRLRRENEVLALSGAHAQLLLDALGSLLQIHPDDDPFERVFESLRRVFSFSSALLLLKPTGESDRMPAMSADLECVVATPPDLRGSRWPVGSLFRRVLHGEVIATFSNKSVAEWHSASNSTGHGQAILDLLDQTALYLPVNAYEQHGVLILLRPSDNRGFHRSDVELGRRFSILVSLALASRSANQAAAEGRRLRDLAQQLRYSEEIARRNSELLQAIMDVLPVGVIVQNEEGSTIMANDMMAFTLENARESRSVSGGERLPFDLADITNDLTDDSIHLRAYRDHLESGQERSGEYSVMIDGHEHTLLVTGKPVRIFSDRLMVSASLDISERKQLERDLMRRALHDPLTGLSNRVRVQDIVTSAIRRKREGGMLALAFIDLDNFKQINDYYSHALGDCLLRAVAERISGEIRSTDTLARISGDEFLLLIDPLERESDLPPIIERVVQSLRQPFLIEGHEILTSASIGASVFPTHGSSFEALCRSADGAMYRAKRDRKGSVTYFDSSMGNALTARMEMEQRLRQAIRDRRFRVAYQAKLGIQQCGVVGLEALVRWVDSDGTVRMPGSFIELASELGLLDTITGFVVEAVAEDMPRISERFSNTTTVSINISAKQAADLSFMTSFIGRLKSLGISDRIVVELTEDAILSTNLFERSILPLLKSAGCRIAMDDFGSGYSSLAMLADLTFDEVKIDRSLITAIHERPRSQSILRAIEALCSGLKAEMVAEGVESIEELNYLRHHSKISIVQGYYFTKPMFIDSLLSNQFLTAATDEIDCIFPATWGKSEAETKRPHQNVSTVGFFRDIGSDTPV